jgi:hypothetical protein
MNRQNLYSVILEKIFRSKFKSGMDSVEFEREDIEKFARTLGVRLPKNFGDLIYSFRFRTEMPKGIRKTSAKGKNWVIQLAGRGKYRFILKTNFLLIPNPSMSMTKVPDSTPGVIAKYAQSDEQALLAKVRYNRLVDVFTGVACYSLQNHLRTTVAGIGQVETDEIYVGVDKKGSHYVFPVQAKGGRDKLNAVQIEQDFELCASKFPSLICRPIGAQFLPDGQIALFEFELDKNGIGVTSERHYKLVPPDDVTEEDLRVYRVRSSE